MDSLSLNNNFTYIDEDGNKVCCDILCDLETTDKNYIIYTNNVFLEDGTKKIYASSYVVNDEKRILKNISSKEEWNMIEAILSYLTK